MSPSRLYHPAYEPPVARPGTGAYFEARQMSLGTVVIDGHAPKVRSVNRVYSCRSLLSPCREEMKWNATLLGRSFFTLWTSKGCGTRTGETVGGRKKRKQCGILKGIGMTPRSDDSHTISLKFATGFECTMRIASAAYLASAGQNVRPERARLFAQVHTLHSISLRLPIRLGITRQSVLERNSPPLASHYQLLLTKIAQRTRSFIRACHQNEPQPM